MPMDCLRFTSPLQIQKSQKTLIKKEKFKNFSYVKKCAKQEEVDEMDNFLKVKDLQKQIIIITLRKVERWDVFQIFRKYGYIEFLKRLDDNEFVIEYMETDSIKKALKYSGATVLRSKVFLLLSNEQDSISKFEQKYQIFFHAPSGTETFEIFSKFRRFGSISFFKRAKSKDESFYTGPGFLTFDDQKAVDDLMGFDTSKKSKILTVKEFKVSVNRMSIDNITSYIEYYNHLTSTKELERLYQQKISE